LNSLHTEVVGEPDIPKVRKLTRPRRRWEDNIRMDLRGMWGEDVVWVRLAQDRDQWQAVVKAVMNLWVL
jgi:hypothetical protein